MNLIDNVDFVFAFRRTVFHLLTDLADVIHTVIRCGIDLDHIHGVARCNRLAGRALSTRAAVYRMLTVDRLCKYLCDGRLTGSPGSTKQIRMPDPVCFDLVF